MLFRAQCDARVTLIKWKASFAAFLNPRACRYFEYPLFDSNPTLMSSALMGVKTRLDTHYEDSTHYWSLSLAVFMSLGLIKATCF